MSILQQRGVISLLPKEDSNLLKHANWRPITLLNVDCKIASKVIATRFEKVLDLLISPDQTGFLKGRYIGQNIRLVNDVVEQTKIQIFQVFLYSLIFVKLLILSNGASLKEVSHSLILETVYNNGSRLSIIIRRGLFLMMVFAQISLKCRGEWDKAAFCPLIYRRGGNLSVQN